MRSMSEAISLGLVSLLSIELFAPVRVPVVQKVPLVQTPSCLLPRVAVEDIEPARPLIRGGRLSGLNSLNLLHCGCSHPAARLILCRTDYPKHEYSLDRRH